MGNEIATLSEALKPKDPCNHDWLNWASTTAFLPPNSQHMSPKKKIPAYVSIPTNFTQISSNDIMLTLMSGFEWNAKLQIEKSCLRNIQNSSLGPRHLKASLIQCNYCVNNVSWTYQTNPIQSMAVLLYSPNSFYQNFMEKSTAPIQVVSHLITIMTTLN